LRISFTLRRILSIKRFFSEVHACVNATDTLIQTLHKGPYVRALTLFTHA